MALNHFNSSNLEQLALKGLRDVHVQIQVIVTANSSEWRKEQNKSIVDLRPIIDVVP